MRACRIGWCWLFGGVRELIGLLLAWSIGRSVVFASNKDRDVGELHANFKLSKEPGGYLALVEGDGQTVANGYIDYPDDDR